LGKKVYLERWVPETDLLKELSISQADQSLHSARKKMELMLLCTNKIPFVPVRKGHAKPLAPFSQLFIKGYYYELRFTVYGEPGFCAFLRVRKPIIVRTT
jgi:hypothetical protein